MPRIAKPGQVKIKVSLPHQLVDKLDILAVKPGRRSYIIENALTDYIKGIEQTLGCKLKGVE